MAPKIRIHQVAAEHGADAKEALEILRELGEFVKSASSTIEAPVARKLRALLQARGHASTSFAGLDADTSAQVASLFERLPRSLPRLLDELAGASARYRSALQAARAAQQVFYIAPRHHRGLASSSAPVRMRRRLLPGGHGLLFLHQSPTRGHVVAWRHEADHVRFEAFTVEAHQGGSDRSVTTAFGDTEFRPRVDEEYLTSAAPSFHRLVAAWELVPMRVRGLPRKTTATTPSSTALTRTELNGTALARYRKDIAPDQERLSAPVSSDAEPRRAKSRWPVRAHWRNQYYPSSDTNMPVYIEAHTAGAPDAPVLQNDRVFIIAPDAKQ